MTKSRNILAPRKPWKPEDLEILRRDYPHMRTDKLAEKMGRRPVSVYQKAMQLGIKKTPEYLASPDACRLRRGNLPQRAIETRFKPGHVPANKGLRRPGYSPGRMSETQFKKGHRPHTWKPVGSYRINADGLLDRKVSDTGYPPRDWVPVHRLVWMEANGPVPEGHRVVFKPGRRTNKLEEITLDAVELVSFEEIMRRNTIHNLPKPLVQVVRLRSAITRQINKRARLEEQD